MILAVAVVGLYVWLIFPLDWQTKAKYKSPEGDIVAYHLQSMSETGEAPYGDHIVIAPSWHLLGQYTRQPVFAGYCAKDLKVSWTSNEALLIECEVERVVTQLKQYGEITIIYKLNTH